MDPVCGMGVDAKSAAASYTLDGTTYLFFFDQSFNAFRQRPERSSERTRPCTSPNWHNDVGYAPDHMPEGFTPRITPYDENAVVPLDEGQILWFR